MRSLLWRKAHFFLPLSLLLSFEVVGYSGAMHYADSGRSIEPVPIVLTVQAPQITHADEPISYILTATAVKKLKSVEFQAQVPAHTRFVSATGSPDSFIIAGPDESGTVSFTLDGEMKKDDIVQIVLSVRTDSDLAGVSTIDFAGFQAFSRKYDPMNTGPVSTQIVVHM